MKYNFYRGPKDTNDADDDLQIREGGGTVRWWCGPRGTDDGDDDIDITKGDSRK